LPGNGFDDEKRRDPAAFERMIDAEYPLGRLGTPEEVAAVVAFLCSAQASLVTAPISRWMAARVAVSERHDERLPDCAASFSSRQPRQG